MAPNLTKKKKNGDSQEGKKEGAPLVRLPVERVDQSGQEASFAFPWRSRRGERFQGLLNIRREQARLGGHDALPQSPLGVDAPTRMVAISRLAIKKRALIAAIERPVARANSRRRASWKSAPLKTPLPGTTKNAHQSRRLFPVHE